MNKLEEAMEMYWRGYLNLQDDEEYFDPPPAYARGFRDGMRYAEGIQSPDEFTCLSCGRLSYPDYGRCAFCGGKNEI